MQFIIQGYYDYLLISIIYVCTTILYTLGEEHSIYIPRDCSRPAPLIKQNSVDYEIIQST